MRALADRPRCAAALLVMLAAACDVNPHDPAQEPRVTVTQGAAGSPIIAWQPAGAQLVRVYRGARAGDGYGPDLMWSIAASTKNSLASGVSYGAAPIGGTTDVQARPLLPGATYTAQVTRQDPKASGDGFTNTANRYVGTATFTVATPAARIR